MSIAFKDAPTQTVDVDGTRFAYRQAGTAAGAPVIFLNHFNGTLDDVDPWIVDGIATEHQVIAFDNRGVGASEGKTPATVAAMAQDAVAFIRALGFDQVDLLAFSLGGLVGQQIVQTEPHLI